MIAADEDAYICDMAETYHIFDYKALPVKLLATLSSGLRADSRIKMILAGSQATSMEILLAGIVDRIGHIAWMLSEDGQNGQGRPKSILRIITGQDQGGEDNGDTGAIQTFDTPEEFEAAIEATRNGRDDNGN